MAPSLLLSAPPSAARLRSVAIPRRTQALAARPLVKSRRVVVVRSSATPPPAADWRERERKAAQHRDEALRAQEAQAQAHRASHARKVELPPGSVTPLDDIEAISFLDSDGLITDMSDPSAKASVYAVYDKDSTLQFIGVTRSIQPTLRLTLARKPELCYSVKVQHIQKPSRALLEGIREQWLEGFPSPGNASEDSQAEWENPVAVSRFMTDEEKAAVTEAPQGPQRIKAIKAASRRVGAEIKAVLEGREVKENLRFDPKLMEKGLLDLKPTQAPDTSVPS